MPNEERWDERFWLYIILRVIFAMIIITIVFGIFFGVWFGGPMMFYPNLFWNVIGILVFIWFLGWILRWPLHRGYWGHEHEMRILRRRYARGEISEAQFKRMMKVLKEGEKSNR